MARIDPKKMKALVERDRKRPAIPKKMPATGGRADGMDAGEFDQQQLAKGIEHEMEHTKNPAVAAKIAADHLAEDPKYYDHLDEMEAKHGKGNAEGEDDEAEDAAEGGEDDSDEGADEDEEDDAEEKDSEIVDAAAKQVAAGKVDPVLDHLMADFDPDHNPPAWVEDESTWNRAKGAVDPRGKGTTYDQPWAVVATVYKAMGGGIRRGGSAPAKKAKE